MWGSARLKTRSGAMATSPELIGNFERKYPPDPLGEELAPNARVWKVYREQATAHDKAMLEGWNNTLDILLIFVRAISRQRLALISIQAGLFSAVVTAFVMESYNLLQANPPDYTASVLYALLASTGNSTAIASIPTPASSVFSEVPVSARWINGLWFSSLALSLVVSLLCILVKQWLDEYAGRMAASSQHDRHWARRRALFFGGIEGWQLAGFMSILPLLLHVALFMFFGGLVILLWRVDHVIGLLLLAVTGTLFAFYLVSTLVPLFRTNCPSATPLLRQLRGTCVQLRRAILRAIGRILLRVIRRYTSAHNRRRRQQAEVRKQGVRLFEDLATPWRRGYLYVISVPPAARTWARGTWTSLQSLRTSRGRESLADRLEKFATRLLDQPIRDHDPADDVGALSDSSGSLQMGDDLDGAVLLWLSSSVSDVDAVAVGTLALGGIPPVSALAKRIRKSAHKQLLRSHANALSTALHSGPVTIAQFLRTSILLTGTTFCIRKTGLSSWTLPKLWNSLSVMSTLR